MNKFMDSGFFALVLEQVKSLVQNQLCTERMLWELQAEFWCLENVWTLNI